MAPRPPTSKRHEALPEIADHVTACSHQPQLGYSLFLEKRCKRIHFLRHGEGLHNVAIRKDPSCLTACEHPDAWNFYDAKLSSNGITQCILFRRDMLDHGDMDAELVVTSPFTRALQSAHIIFAGSTKGRVPFIVHDDCGERRGKYTCDKRRDKSVIMQELQPVFDYTGDSIDFDSFAFSTESDELWTEQRESDESVNDRVVAMLQWLATRPEKEIAVVTHSSWLRVLFSSFGEPNDKSTPDSRERISVGIEKRSVTLASHKRFLPHGTWESDGCKECFVPDHSSFRRGSFAPEHHHFANLHGKLGILTSTQDSLCDTDLTDER